VDEISSSQPARARKAADARLGDKDMRMLAFAAEHRFFLGAHARTMLGLSPRSASSRLGNLADAGWLRYERKLAGPGCYQITRRGLNLIGSTLPRPRAVDLATYDHEVGLGWLWLAAERGAFGALRGVFSERLMRSQDRRRADAAERLGVRLPGVGPYGGERRHYPDLLLDTAGGHRVAVELELTRKSPARRAEILGGYALDGRIDAVLYLVETERAGRAIERSARAAGISDRVQIQLVEFTAGSGAIGAGRGAVRRSARETGRDGHRAAPETRERAR
jgi:hypothetical protein